MTKKQFLLYITIAVTSYGSTLMNANSLQKVYHHRNPAAQNYIELGSVVLYFEQKPIITALPERADSQRKKNSVELTFFFPQTSVYDAACKQMIARLGKTTGAGYQIAVQEVQTPAPGIKVTIAYDNKKVAFSYDHYESDGLQRGLIFRFYNKALLEKISSRGSVLLRTAQVKKKPVVVLDCGHGGHDTGACGYFNIKEKDITAAVGKYLASLLRAQGISVQLTRKKDCHVNLDERTYCANKCAHENTVFVSLHANSAENNQVCGVETYYLDEQLLEIMRDNKMVQQDCAQLQMLQTAYTPCNEIVITEVKRRCEESKKLAYNIHQQLLSTLNQQYHVSDRKVRGYAYQVLIGTSMPAVLIELGFLTNEQEAALLRKKEYQQLLAQGIAQAIYTYLEEKTG